MDASPIDRFLAAVDALDVDATMAALGPRCRLLMADGHRAEGVEEVRRQLVRFLAQLRSTTHRIVRRWHDGDAWIAEVEADYELTDRLQIKAIPRAVFMEVDSDGATDVRIYGAHEHPLADHGSGEEGLHLGGRWIPPL